MATVSIADAGAQLGSSVVKQAMVALVAVILVFVGTWVITSLRFRRDLQRHLAHKHNQQREGSEPITIPYVIPWLGSYLAFLYDQNAFFDRVRSQLEPHGLHVCGLQTGPMMTYVLFSGKNTSTMFKASKTVTAGDRLERMLAIQGFGMPPRDVDIFQLPADEEYSSPENVGMVKRKLNQKALHIEYMEHGEASNTHAAMFVKELDTILQTSTSVKGEWETVNLFEWLRTRMFEASIIAVQGRAVLEMCPNLERDFWILDANFLHLSCGAPKILCWEGHNGLKGLLDQLEVWAASHKDLDWETLDSHEWEPLLGSRWTRERHKAYEEVGLSDRGKASLEVAMILAQIANAVPATAWMLFHILADGQLLRRVKDEINATLPPMTDDQGAPNLQVDVAVLSSLPLLQSIYSEALRLYMSITVTREVKSDMALDGYLLKKSNMLMAPSWITHRDEVAWKQHNPTAPPASVFYPDRFIRHADDDTGGITYTTHGTTGLLIPYGGGVHICPGRFFAKLKMLATVVMLLRGFDVEFVEWTAPVDALPPRLWSRRRTVENRFPHVSAGYGGIGVQPADRDMKVRIRRKHPLSR